MEHNVATHPPPSLPLEGGGALAVRVNVVLSVAMAEQLPTSGVDKVPSPFKRSVKVRSQQPTSGVDKVPSPSRGGLGRGWVMAFKQQNEIPE